MAPEPDLLALLIFTRHNRSPAQATAHMLGELRDLVDWVKANADELSDALLTSDIGEHWTLAQIVEFRPAPSPE